MSSKNLLAENLAKVAARYPSATHLAALAVREGEASTKYLRAHFRLRTDTWAKNLILGFLISGSWPWTTARGPSRVRNAVLAAARYFAVHPERPLHRPLVELRGDTISRALLVPLGHHRRIEATEIVPEVFVKLRAMEPGHALVREFRAGRRLTKRAYRTVRDGRLHDRTVWFYFRTGDPVLDAVNALRYVVWLLQDDHIGGRLQNKIPQEVSRLFGIRRLSLPELRVAVDVLALAWSGAIPLETFSAKRDPLGLRPVLIRLRDAPRTDGVAQLMEDIFAMGVLTRRIARGIEYRKRPPHFTKFDTGLVFNVARLVGLAIGAEGRRGREFRKFGPYYKNVDDAVLRGVVCRHYRKVAPGFARRLNSFMRRGPIFFRGMRIRDRANCLFLISVHERKNNPVSTYLPSVAAYALGQPEPRVGGRRRQRYAPRPRREAPAARRLRLRVLTELGYDVAGLAE